MASTVLRQGRSGIREIIYPAGDRLSRSAYSFLCVLVAPAGDVNRPGGRVELSLAVDVGGLDGEPWGQTGQRAGEPERQPNGYGRAGALHPRSPADQRDPFRGG